MKIIQLNLWHGKLGDAVIGFLNAQQPDIVCLQEATKVEGPTAGIFVPLHTIQEKTGFTHGSFAPTVSYQFMDRKCQFGNAILSRFPLNDEKTTFIYGAYSDNSDGAEEQFNNRNLLSCQVSLSGRRLTIINHHGYRVPRNPLGNEKSVRAIEKVASIVDNLDEPIIFCTDLNVSPNSPALHSLRQLRLRDLSTESQLTTTLSQVHPAQEPVACDYIFVSPSVKITSFTASDELISDHKALVLEFEL